MSVPPRKPVPHSSNGTNGKTRPTGRAAHTPAPVAAPPPSEDRLAVEATNGAAVSDDLDELETPVEGEVVAAPILEEPDESALKEVAAEVVSDEELEKVIEHTLQTEGVGDVAADTVRLYLREIGSTPLLNATDETELAIRMEKGREADAKLAVLGIPSSVPNWAASASAARDAAQLRGEAAANAEGNPIPLPADIEQLVIERERGNTAKQRLVQANLRLVVSIARRYLGRGLSLPDLIQEGNLGLMRAADKFDFRRGFKFSTYATWWIRQAITRAISDQGRTIRLPVHVSEMVARLRRATHQLQQDLHREPTEDELANELHTTPSKVRRIMEIAKQPVSLEAPLDESEDSFLGDFIEDSSVATPLEEAQRQLLREEVQKVLANLSERERRIVELRFGLEDGKQRTLEEVAQQFGITRERIRQIETKILRKLRHQRFGGSKLQSYLND